MDSAWSVGCTSARASTASQPRTPARARGRARPCGPASQRGLELHQPPACPRPPPPVRPYVIPPRRAQVIWSLDTCEPPGEQPGTPSGSAGSGLNSSCITRSCQRPRETAGANRGSPQRPPEKQRAMWGMGWSSDDKQKDKLPAQKMRGMWGPGQREEAESPVGSPGGREDL